MSCNIDITDYTGSQVIALSDSRQRALRKTAFDFWRSNGFPFRFFSDIEMENVLELLTKYNKARLSATLEKPSMVGLALANSFHPQIWSARVRGKSAKQIFEDDESFRKIISKLPRLYPNRRCWNAACIRMALGLQNRSRVANFRPTVARAVIDSIASRRIEILDFCAGYGGRFLGALSLNHSYFGIDVSADQTSGLRRMARKLGRFVPVDSQFKTGESEKILPCLESRSFDAVFTSPPYFRLEKYCNRETQCWRKYGRYIDWKERFLFASIDDSLRLLRSGGFLVLNLANYRGYTIADDARKYLSSIRQINLDEWSICMSTNPRLKKANGLYKKSEPLFVVQKK